MTIDNQKLEEAISIAKEAVVLDDDGFWQAGLLYRDDILTLIQAAQECQGLRDMVARSDIKWQKDLEREQEVNEQLRADLAGCIERIKQFDKCIRRIAAAVTGKACAGVDTDDNGGHTAEVLVDAVEQRRAEIARLRKQLPEVVTKNFIENYLDDKTVCFMASYPNGIVIKEG